MTDPAPRGRRQRAADVKARDERIRAHDAAVRRARDLNALIGDPYAWRYIAAQAHLLAKQLQDRPQHQGLVPQSVMLRLAAVADDLAVLGDARHREQGGAA